MSYSSSSAGPEVLGDQDRIAAQADARRGAELARDDPQQPVRQVLEVVHAVGQQRVLDLAHAHPRALLDALDRRFGGQAGIDRLVDPPAPAFVVGEHLVGLEHLLVLAVDAELGLAGHLVDLLAHLVEREVDPLALGLGVLGHGLLDGDARLVEHRLAEREALHQLQALEHLLARMRRLDACRALVVDQPGVVDQLGQHHRDRLQRLDLDFLVAARLDVLDGQHADRALAPHDRHAGERVELLLAGFGAVLELGMGRRFGEVERLDVLRDRAGQALADAELGDVDRALVEAARGEQLEHAFAQQVDRADLAIERLADDLDDLVELALRVGARGHHLVQLGEDRAGCGGGGHRLRLSHMRGFGNARPCTGEPLRGPSARRPAPACPGARTDRIRLAQLKLSSSLILSFCFLSVWIIVLSGAGRLISSRMRRSSPSCFA